MEKYNPTKIEKKWPSFAKATDSKQDILYAEI